MKFLLPIFSLALLSGCAGGLSSRGIVDAGAGAAGGYVAHELSDGDPLWTAVGAGGAVLVSEGVQASIASSKKKQAKTSYELGQSDAIKRHYWMLQRLQKDSTQKPVRRVALYPVPATSSDPDINEVPHEVMIRVEE